MYWLASTWNIHLLYQYDPATATAWLDSPKTFALSGSPTAAQPALDGFTYTPVVNYQSFAQFQADLAAGISPAFQWVLYDPESWPQTPLNEKQDPWTYLRLFGELAHAHGYRVIAAPARDLGTVSGSVQPRLSGEALNDWYLRVNLAGTAAYYADAVDIQAQANEATLSTYDSFTNSAKSQISSANPYALVLAGVSTNTGTPQQMAAAAKSVAVDGYWLNIITTQSNSVQLADQFLKLM